MNASYLICVKVFVLEKLFVKRSYYKTQCSSFIAAQNVQLYCLPNRTSMYRLSKYQCFVNVLGNNSCCQPVSRIISPPYCFLKCFELDYGLHRTKDLQK